MDAGRQVEVDLFHAPRFVHTRLRPTDAVEPDAIIFGQEPADIDARRLRPFRNTDRPALQILRIAYAAIAADVDRGMAKDPGRKNRNADNRGRAVARHADIFREGSLRDIELKVFQITKEYLLDREDERRQRNSLRLDKAAGEVSGMVIFRHRQSEAEAGRRRSLGELR